NNGGDAIVTADNLYKQGFNCDLYIVGDASQLSLDTANILSQISMNYKWIVTKNDLKDVGKNFKDYDYLIDGLFGVGLSRPLEGLYLDMVEKINQTNLYTFSIEIASGIHADTGKALSSAVKANETIAIQCAKFGHYLQDAKDYTGKLTVIDVGIISKKNHKKAYVLDKDMIKKTMPPRQQNTHKYDYGKIVIFGGSPEMMGAPNLAAEAALRSGSGIIKIAVLKKYYEYIYRLSHEVMFTSYKSDDIDDVIEKTDAILFGPGLGKEEDNYEKTLEALIKSEIPVVIDADGIDYFKEIFDSKLPTENLILTPHMGEFSRLINTRKENIYENPMKSINHFMEKYKGVLIVKGPSTIIAYQRLIFIMPYGGAFLATAGSGDVLGGIITSLIGQKKSLVDASCLGTLIHALAGEEAQITYGEDSLLAQDIIDKIFKIIKLAK
ncbi:MAG: NAD(P)H-hydrate dehydratase, partial [Candidatus Izemoplasmataceae bacterium]